LHERTIGFAEFSHELGTESYGVSPIEPSTIYNIQQYGEFVIAFRKSDAKRTLILLRLS
jgi:hypothetical protein